MRHKRDKRVYALPSSCDIQDPETSKILPRYFEIYTETICSYEHKPRACIDTMIIPDMEKQHEIVRDFTRLVNTYPMDDIPSVKYSLLKLIIQGDEETLTKLLSLLNTYAVSIMMISEIVRDISM
jgi:hypothetical protein